MFSPGVLLQQSRPDAAMFGRDRPTSGRCWQTPAKCGRINRTCVYFGHVCVDLGRLGHREAAGGPLAPRGMAGPTRARHGQAVGISTAHCRSRRTPPACRASAALALAPVHAARIQTYSPTRTKCGFSSAARRTTPSFTQRTWATSETEDPGVKRRRKGRMWQPSLCNQALVALVPARIWLQPGRP